eukprot:scaffold637_cov118-Isochrysis_galbana.AAC.25
MPTGTLARRPWPRLLLNPPCRSTDWPLSCRQTRSSPRCVSHLAPLHHLPTRDLRPRVTPDGARQALASYVVVDDRDDVWDAVSRPFIMKVAPFKAFKLDGTIVAPPRNPHARQAAAAGLRPLGAPPPARREVFTARGLHTECPPSRLPPTVPAVTTCFTRDHLFHTRPPA